MLQRLVRGLAALLAAAVSAAASAQSIDRIEPPSWWIGFEHRTLDLLVYGENAAAFQPQIDHAGVRLTAVERLDNPNYLVLRLEIEADAAPGEMRIGFARPDGEAVVTAFPLRVRDAGSAARDGFDASDTVYLVQPDRFANGDTDNDTVEGYADGLNRADPGGRHGGDLQGLIDRLDYIADLGFTQLWLNPVQENAEDRNSYHGYAITDHYRVDPRYGDLALYCRLSEAAAARGIGLIQDVVPNHAGSNHHLFRDPPAADWFNNGGAFTPNSHRQSTINDPYAAAVDRAGFTDGWFAPTMPDFNQRNPHVAQYLIQNAIWWIETAALSGLRVDTWAFSDPAFLDAYARRILSEYPDLGLVGEAWSLDPAVIAPFHRGGPLNPRPEGGAPQLMDFPLQHAVREALLAEDGWNAGLAGLYSFMIHDRLYADPAQMMTFLDNHDFDRIHTQLGEDAALTRLALAHLMTVRGIPQVLYGTEILMTNANPGDHGEVRSDFPGGFAGDVIDAFTGEGLSPEQAEMQAYLRRLTRWRRDATVIHTGAMTHFAPEEAHDRSVYVYVRHDETDAVMVVLNKAQTPVALDLERYRERLAGYSGGVDVITGQRVAFADGVAAPARAALILELD